MRKAFVYHMQTYVTGMKIVTMDQMKVDTVTSAVKTLTVILNVLKHHVGQFANVDLVLNTICKLQ